MKNLKNRPRRRAPEMVEVVVRVPARVLAGYDADVAGGIHQDRDEALRAGLIESWRYFNGRYSTLRIELRNSPSKRPDTDKADPMDTLAAADALTDPETGEPEAGEAPDEDERR